MSAPCSTHFAPAGRYSPEEIRDQQFLVHRNDLFQAMLDAMPGMVLVVNDRRQVVAANRAVLDMDAAFAERLLGQRPGELLGCAHCDDGCDGCGTGRHCAACGAVRAILASQTSGAACVEECRLLLRTPQAAAMDLRVTATPLRIEGQTLTLCAVEDISQQKRLAVLTRMFFHDVLNTAGGIQGYAYTLAEDFGDLIPDRQPLDRLSALADQLIDEIEAQRDLNNAETGDLMVRPEPVSTSALLRTVLAGYSAHPAAEGRQICADDVWEGNLVTDVRLVGRVLGNMLKNALEATAPGGTVTLRCRQLAQQVVFSVHNLGTMPEQVQLQVFHRNFSTKALAGRGIGTHSMKLLGEKYLGGTIDFLSREPEGTTFVLTLPKVLLTD